MRSFRFSIANLLRFIVVLGFSFAAFRSPSQLWANAWFSVALAILTIAVLAAIYRRGMRRAFWVGFASCGWIYFVLALGPWFNSEVSPYLLTTAALDLLYPQVVPPPAAMPMGGTVGMSGGSMMASPGMPPGAPGMMGSGMMGGGMGMMGGGMGTMGGGMAATSSPSAWSAWTETDRSTGEATSVGNVSLVSSETFRRIGHSLFCLLCALFGGILTRRLAATREDQGPPS